MQIKTKDFIELLYPLEVSLPTRDINPVLSCIRFSQGQAEAYNGVIYCCIKNKNIDFEAMIDAKLLFTMLQALKGKKLNIQAKQNNVIIKSGKFIGTLAIIDNRQGIDLSLISKKVNYKKLYLPPKELLDLFSSIINESTVSLIYYKGINVYGKTGFCTDGYTLIKYSGKYTHDKLFIPIEVIRILEHCKEKIISVEVGEYNFKISLGGTEYYIGIKPDVDLEENLEKKYKELSKIVPKNLVARFEVNKKLFRVLDRINIVSKLSLENSCKLSFDSNRLTLFAAHSTAFVEESIPTIGKGKFSVLVRMDSLLQMIKFAGENQKIYLSTNVPKPGNAILHFEKKNIVYYINSNL